MNNFTMSEFIQAHGLDVSPHDPTATKMITRALKERGFRRRRVKRDGEFKLIWTSDPVKDYSDLQKKLAAL